MEIAAEAQAAEAQAAPRLLSEGSASGQPLRSILAQEGEDGNRKQKKRVRIMLEGEGGEESAGLQPSPTAASAGEGRCVVGAVERC